MGSSPRIRGKLGGKISSLVGTGIIPANTGKIWCSTWREGVDGDHPREYGENATAMAVLSLDPGSSPRIRGKSPRGWATGVQCGIIPANTGKIHLGTPVKGVWWDHPREYGENSKLLRRLPVRLGSSPRIRGKFGQRGVVAGKLGIIPANTGKMLMLW